MPPHPDCYARVTPRHVLYHWYTVSCTSFDIGDYILYVSFRIIYKYITTYIYLQVLIYRSIAVYPARDNIIYRSIAVYPARDNIIYRFITGYPEML